MRTSLRPESLLAYHAVKDLMAAAAVGEEGFRPGKVIPEPVFGWIKHILGFRRASMRGLERVKEEWDLICLAVPAPKDGYIQGVDNEALVRLARQQDTIVRMERGIGEFVVKGTILAFLAGEGEAEPEVVATHLGVPPRPGTV